MADADNLDALSNAELRAQMLAQGLPNIPVTDSSRKVLVKRLRASLGGNSPLPASPKKSSNRRETLQPVAAAAAATVSVDKRDGANTARDASSLSKARRTIAATPNETKEAERRRQPLSKPETVAPLPRVPEATVAKPVGTIAAPAAKAAAPIQSRRTSNTDRREMITERVVKMPETIVEK